MPEATAGRSAAFADQFEAAQDGFIRLIEGLDDKQWNRVGKNYPQRINEEDEGRSVGVIAHHVAHGHLDTLDELETALAGNEVTITIDEINVENAEHAATYHDVAREETIQLLVENGDRLCARIAGLSDEELARKSFHRGAGREMSVAAYAELGHRHVAGHLVPIRRALDL